MLLGAQSVTGRNVARGDRVGVSALSAGQEKVLNALGSSHSDAVDKFADLDYTCEDSAILMDGASVQMVVEVIDILYLAGIEEDKLVYGLIKSHSRSGKRMLTIDQD